MITHTIHSLLINVITFRWFRLKYLHKDNKKNQKLNAEYISFENLNFSLWILAFGEDLLLVKAAGDGVDVVL